MVFGSAYPRIVSKENNVYSFTYSSLLKSAFKIMKPFLFILKYF